MESSKLETRIPVKKILLIIGSFIILVSCSNTVQNNKPKSKSIFNDDPVMECRRHCNMNFSACVETANSPEARSECISTRQVCLEGC